MKKVQDVVTFVCGECAHSVTFLNEHPRLARMRLKRWTFSPEVRCAECNGKEHTVLSVRGLVPVKGAA